MKYYVRQYKTGLDEKGIEETKILLCYCTLFSDDPQISSVRGSSKIGNKKRPDFIPGVFL